MTTNKIELLAPAGDMECLWAAVNNGADAVYMGGSKFSARAYASNFDLTLLQEAVDYCHIYGVKVYITINTLIKQNELKEVLEYVNELYMMGVDALIVQDMGVSACIRRYFPDFELHASTQVTIHNLEGAKFLQELGFSRIVLSRELSLEEIKNISKQVETEIFVHGALCVCYSGQCLTSSIIGGRSGNRGRCAQPCRLPYDIVDRANGRNLKGYLMSPKDICTLNDLKHILESGVKSLKIEGRMKKPEYVAGVVSSYKKVIEDYNSGKTKASYEEENSKLLQLFNREGFSKAYLFGNTGAEMMAYNSPKNTGVPIGKVEDGNLVELLGELSLKDGIRVGDEGAAVSKIILKGKEVQTANKGNRVKIIPSIYKKNDIIYKTSDINLNEELKAMYEDKYMKKISIDFAVKFEVGKPLTIEAVYDGKFYSYEGTVVEEALKKPLTEETIEEKLRKTGNTPFHINNINFIVYEEGYTNISALNEARRQLLDNITEDLQKSYRRESNFTAYSSNKINSSEEVTTPEYIFVASSNEQVRALKDAGVRAVAVDLFKKIKDKIDMDKVDFPEVYIKLPNIVRDEMKQILDKVALYKDKVKGVITANLGLIKELQGTINIIGDYKLNIFNSESVRFINEYCSCSALSVELNRKEIREITKNIKNENIPLQAIIYGKLELMVSEYCPIGSTFGGKTSSNKCSNECLKGQYSLKDRTQKHLAILNDNYCRSYIYNSVPLNLTSVVEELKDTGVKHFRLDFIDETYEETLKVAKSIMEPEAELVIDNFTYGHYKRGVE